MSFFKNRSTIIFITSFLVAICYIFIACQGSQTVEVAENTSNSDTSIVSVDPSIGDIDVTEPAISDTDAPSPITWTDCDQWLGSHPCDFTLVDQNGDDWNLYDHYGSVIIIDFSTMWCSVCKMIAPEAQMVQDKYQAYGYDVIWVTVLIEDEARNPVVQEDLVAWANAYNLTSTAVLLGSRDLVDLTGIDGYPISAWPTLVVITDEMILYNGMNGWNGATVLGWVDEVLGR